MNWKKDKGDYFVCYTSKKGIFYLRLRRKLDEGKDELYFIGNGLQRKIDSNKHLKKLLYNPFLIIRNRVNNKKLESLSIISQEIKAMQR